MFTPDLACLPLRENSDLPKNTLVAPLSVIREIRLVLGKVAIDMQVGLDEAVICSPDLYAAFNAWSAAQPDGEVYEEETDGDENAWLN